MGKRNPIRRIMDTELPSLTYQRRKSFRPTNADVTYAYNVLNRHIFDGELIKPTITQGIIKQAWGMCNWMPTEQYTGSCCDIRLSDKWFCQQWFLNTLAHEMVHQYQWDIHRWDYIDYFGRDIHTNSGGHGPSFYMWREKFEYYGLTLKISFSQRRWFKHQDFTKC